MGCSSGWRGGGRGRGWGLGVGVGVGGLVVVWNVGRSLGLVLVWNLVRSLGLANRPDIDVQASGSTRTAIEREGHNGCHKSCTTNINVHLSAGGAVCGVEVGDGDGVSQGRRESPARDHTDRRGIRRGAGVDRVSGAGRAAAFTTESDQNR